MSGFEGRPGLPSAAPAAVAWRLLRRALVWGLVVVGGTGTLIGGPPAGLAAALAYLAIVAGVAHLIRRL